MPRSPARTPRNPALRTSGIRAGTATLTTELPDVELVARIEGLRHHLSAERWARRRVPGRWTLSGSRLFKATNHRGGVVGHEDAFMTDFQFLIVEPDYG